MSARHIYVSAPRIERLHAQHPARCIVHLYAVAGFRSEHMQFPFRSINFRHRTVARTGQESQVETPRNFARLIDDERIRSARQVSTASGLRIDQNRYELLFQRIISQFDRIRTRHGIHA